MSNKNMVLPEEIVDIVKNEGFSCDGKFPNKIKITM